MSKHNRRTWWRRWCAVWERIGLLYLIERAPLCIAPACTRAAKRDSRCEIHTPE